MQAALRAWGAWLLLLVATPSPAAQDLRSPAFMAQIREGFTETRSLDYDLAEQTFGRLQREFPAHPAPPLLRAVVIWLSELFEREELNLDLFIAPGYFTSPARRVMARERRAAFDDLIRQSQDRSRAIIRHDPGHPDARYFLGASFGVLAAFTFTIDRSYLQALRYAREAYGYERALIEEHPQYYDAYMYAGMYEYVAASVPWYVKWLAALIGFRGSKEQGLNDLSLAAQHGQYVADDARMLRMVLLVRENRLHEALEEAERLHRAFPRNYLLHLNQAQILERLSRETEAAMHYREVLARAEAGRSNYHKLRLVTFRYTIGKKLMDLGDHRGALEQFEKSLRDSGTPERERALSHLGAGQILDLAGQRAAAIAHYTTVLRLRNVEDSHALARRFLKRPYSQTGRQSGDRNPEIYRWATTGGPTDTQLQEIAAQGEEVDDVSSLLSTFRGLRPDGCADAQRAVPTLPSQHHPRRRLITEITSITISSHGSNFAPP